MSGAWIRTGLAGFTVAVTLSVWAIHQNVLAEQVGTQRVEAKSGQVADFQGFDVFTLAKDRVAEAPTAAQLASDLQQAQPQVAAPMPQLALAGPMQPSVVTQVAGAQVAAAPVASPQQPNTTVITRQQRNISGPLALLGIAAGAGAGFGAGYAVGDGNNDGGDNNAAY